MRAAIYSRVSTEDQAKEGFSIAAQNKRLNAYCKARGWMVVDQYVDDGYSGRNPERPEYKRMLIEKDRWDVLVVLKMDRIHRNSRNFTIMMDFLRSWGKEFNSMQESFDTTTAIGRFVMDTIQRIAQLESEQIGERVKVGMTQKALMNKGNLGNPEPYGYHYVDGKLEIEPIEADTVRRMFSMILSLNTLSDICRFLNASNIASKKGAQWQRATVHGILVNPIYTGQREWDGIGMPDIALRIVDRSVFDEVQTILSDRMKSVPRPKRMTTAQLFRSEAHA